MMATGRRTEGLEGIGHGTASSGSKRLNRDKDVVTGC